MSDMIEKIRKIDKKTMRNNVLLGLIVTLGTGFYLYMNKKTSQDEPIYLEEPDSDTDSDTDSLHEYSMDERNNVNDNLETSKVIFEDLKQTLLNKLEETDKNNRTELKKLEDDIRTISEKLDKTQLTPHIEKDAEKSASLLDYIFPSTEKQNNAQEVNAQEEPKKEEVIKSEEPAQLVPEVLNKPPVEEPKKEEVIKPEEPTQLVPEVLNKPPVEEPKKEEVIKPTQLVPEVLNKPPVEEPKKEEVINPEEYANANANANANIDAQKQLEIKEEEKKIEGGGGTIQRNKNKSKKNKNKNKALKQILKKLGYTIKKR